MLIHYIFLFSLFDRSVELIINILIKELTQIQYQVIYLCNKIQIII